MHADLFYQSNATGLQGCPLFLMTQAQWENAKLDLTNAEHNFFIMQQFAGKLGDVCVIIEDKGGEGKGKLVRAYIGMGENDVQPNDAQAIAESVSRLPPGYYLPQQDWSSLALLIWALTQYRFDSYKKLEILPRILLLDEAQLASVNPQAKAIFLVRDLINKPANDLGPKELAEVASQLANNYGAEFEQWVGDELLTANFPAIHAVGRAAANAPRLVSLTWGRITHPRITLIGKGVCFDSGGLDIKPTEGMRLMKKDMGGAAHVLGLAQWIMTNQLPIYLQVLIPAVENSVGSQSFRPGDVLTMRNGLTVEVDNTDAEGRLVLADALTKAEEFNPELVIDFATLTGAARVAVGTEIAALFTPDETLAAELLAASLEVGDPIWRLPLFTGYERMLDSKIADLVNAASVSYAGAITAALFLKHFIPVGASWAHFDIMAWNLSAKPGKPEGGEAMGIRAVAHYLQKKYR